MAGRAGLLAPIVGQKKTNLKQQSIKGGRSMDFVTLMTLKLTANKIGTDQFSNHYYEERRARAGKPPRRYVRYNGIAEASKVPADWHGWLHHTFDELPTDTPLARQAWEKDHHPNLTGTVHAYRPTGSLAVGDRRQSTTGDYQAWSPDEA